MVHSWVPAHCAGAELTAYQLCRHLAARGHTVDVVLSSQTGPHYDIEGMSVFPRVGPADPLAWFADPARRPDLVITYLENTTRAAILCRMHGVPLAQLIHNTFQFSLDAVAKGPSDLITYHAQWVREEFEAHLSQFRHNPVIDSIMVHPAVYRDEYISDVARTGPGDAITLVNVWPNKGSELFWKLADAMPDLQFLGVKGGYGEQDIRTAPNVEILEHVPAHRMHEVYDRSRLVLMPSIYESYGRVAVEAACAGVPTIAHPTPGLREALGDAGIFADRDDIEAWTKAIRSVLQPKNYAAARRRSVALALAQDPEGDLDRWCDLAEEVARRGPVAAARAGR